MELTDDIIDMTYKFAWTFLKRSGRSDIDAHDLAHDAFIKLAHAAPVKPEHLQHRIWLDIKSVFFESYTNATTRKHNLLLDTDKRMAAEVELATTDPEVVSAQDLFIWALKSVYETQPTQCEILMLTLTGKTVQEIAAMRNTSTQAVDQLKQKARKTIAVLLGMAA